MKQSLPSLFVRGRALQNVFDLTGHDEDGITRAIAWGLRSSPGLLSAFVSGVLGRAMSTQNVSLSIHTHAPQGGITDLEIASRDFHVIVEAKKGWVLPGRSQLSLYAGRKSFRRSLAPVKKLVTLSECTESYAATQLKMRKVRGMELCHVSWRSLATWCTKAMREAGHGEKRLLRELGEYLENVMTSQRQDSNLVYVVALGLDAMRKGTTDTWIDVVERDHCYFHPIKKNWPREPPNYVGFRYRGKLQSVHHVESYEVVMDLKATHAGWPKTKSEHFVYRLGPPIRPAKEIRTGKIYMNGRVSCAIDTLLSGQFPTISAARDETKRRLGARAR